MRSGRFRFDRFSLDVAERRLWSGAEPVEVTARYLDALILLVREPGALVTKERFLEEVWGGVPVTDEALTQCIKTLRRKLGDSATDPRFIETVPKHGYRFIGRVEVDAGEHEPASPQPPAGDAAPFSWRQLLLLGGAGTIGGGVAGVIGGVFFGFVGAAQSQRDGLGAFSILFVLLAVHIPIGMMGGAGVGVGLGLAGAAPGRSWWRSVLGGAGGGLAVGGIANLLGTDAFRLLVGRAPAHMTGGGEGLLLGAAAGFALWLASRGSDKRLGYGLAWAAVVAGMAGMLIPLLGGRLMGGSLALLSGTFPQSPLHLEPFAGLFGEGTLGRFSQIAESGLEGALFGACVVGAVISAYRHSGRVIVKRS